MENIKVLKKIEGTDLVQVEIDHVVQIKYQDDVDKLLNKNTKRKEK